MRRGSHRHPALEAAVFAAALLLAVFVGRELWRRRAPAPLPDAAFQEMAEHDAAVPRPLPLHGTVQGGRTETSVSSVPPIKLTRVQRRRTKRAVPLPK